MTEEWRWIPEYEGFYQVSNKGRIRSVDRVIAHKQGPMRRKGVMLKQRLVKGYPMVCLRNSGESEYMTVHKAVLLAFPKGSGDQCRHLDGNPTNNEAHNLKWGTALENSADRARHGTAARGESSGRSVLTTPTVITIKRLSDMGYGPTNIGLLVNMDKSRVYEVTSGKTWKHVD